MTPNETREESEMRQELQRYLDGDLARADLPKELRQEADAWEALLADVQSTAVFGAPPWLEAKVQQAVEASGRPAWRRGLDWLRQPRTIRVAPGPALAALAGLVLALTIPWGGGPTGPPEDTVYVQLFLEAPAASSVAIAGDFNSWEPIQLEDPNGDGVWSARLAVQPGIYEYMFLLDGSRWMADPHAEWYSDDGFGNRNAVLAILPEARGT